MNVLVTGASGYIGSHVCKKLAEHGHSIEGWDINIHGEYNNVSHYCTRILHRDFTSVRWYELWMKPDAIVHLGGRSVVPTSMKEPTEYYRVNTMGTANLIDMFEKWNPHLIFASTSSGFAMVSPYARSKVAAEDIIKEKCDKYTIFRFFNVSGTDGVNRQLGDASHLIRRAAMAAANKLEHISIYGTDYDTRDGTCIRDYVHVDDLSNAIVKAVESKPMNTPYECLGSKTGYTVYEVLDTMEKVTGKKIKKMEAPRREGDSECNIVDNLSSLIKLEKTLDIMCKDQYNLERGRNI